MKSSDWILFDIDYTLTEPIDPALNMNILKLDMPRFLEELETFTEKQKELVPILMNTQVPSKLTEPCASDLIKKLQESAATILGFTAADTASLPDVGAITSWRRNELLRLGIDFKPPHSASPIPTTIAEFTQFPSFRGTFPVYIDGILYTNVFPTKAEVLSAFLDAIKDRPDQIIFIDDTLNNLRIVEAEFCKRGVAFLGIHFKPLIDNQLHRAVSEDAWRKTWMEIHRRAEQISLSE